MSVRRLSSRPLPRIAIRERQGQFHLTLNLSTATMELSSAEMLLTTGSDHDLRVLSNLVSAQAELKELGRTDPALPAEPAHPRIGGGTRLSADERAVLNRYFLEREAHTAEVERIRRERATRIAESENRTRVLLSDAEQLPSIKLLLSKPVELFRTDRNDDRFFVLYQDQLWASLLDLDEDQWTGLIKQDVAREKRRLDRALGQTSKPRLRTAIPTDVRRAVWARDGGVCAKCGSRERLEFDHIIPVSQGGSTTERNLELLCETCNRVKADQLG
jgi:5-methylcytosine-specific restriction endonuclease McrA